MMTKILEEIKKRLSEYTGKRYIYLTKRGNESIKIALRIAKDKVYSEIFIQDQGGWMTYPQIASKNKLEVKKIKTDHGIIDDQFNNCCLLINTMPGYCALQDIRLIKTNNCFIINDVSGSIGYNVAKYGDIVFGSFGKWKPLSIGSGGFIATDDVLDFNEHILSDEEMVMLLEELQRLENKQKKFAEIQDKLKKELTDYNIIHKNLKGINVLIKADEKESKKIISYCEQNGYEYTECPRYIRMLDEGISIEIKRKKV